MTFLSFDKIDPSRDNEIQEGDFYGTPTN